jgi:MFS transporter, DHA2 family, multidrug resistance protein
VTRPVSGPSTAYLATGIADRVGPRTWLGFLAMCLGMFMAILDIQIVASSLPEIQAAVGIPSHQLSWIQTAYLIAEVIAIPLTGWLTRLMTLRGMFVSAAVGFTAASVGCALSNSFASLVAFRVVQGFCGGAIIPAVFTSVFVLFPRGRQVRATAVAGVFAVLAPTLGPVVGGYITETYSWHWLFLINLAPGIVVSLLVGVLLRTGRADWTLLRSFDFASLALLAACLASLEIMLKEAPARGWANPLILALSALCLATAAALIPRNLRRARPLIVLNAFRDRSFAVGCVYSFVLGAGLYGSVYLVPIFLGFIRDHSPLEIGIIMLVGGAAQLFIAPIAAPMERRVNRRLLTGIGYGVFAAGLIANGFATYETDYDGLFWPQILRGAAVMFCLLPTTSLALEGQTADSIADASGFFNLMRNLGGAIGIALVDTVLELRPATHAARLVERLQAGDPVAAAFVGLPLDRFHNVPLGPIDAATQETVRPLVERAAAVASFNDAYFLLSALFLLSLVLLPFLRPTPAPPEIVEPITGI